MPGFLVFISTFRQLALSPSCVLLHQTHKSKNLWKPICAYFLFPSYITHVASSGLQDNKYIRWEYDVYSTDEELSAPLVGIWVYMRTYYAKNNTSDMCEN